MRIASVMAGLAVALAMCFAVPIASASPLDHLSFDSGGSGFELVAAPIPTDMAPAADVFDFAVPMISAAAPEVEPVNCSAGPAWAAASPPLLLGSSGVERLSACTSRRHDPGWRAG